MIARIQFCEINGERSMPRTTTERPRIDALYFGERLERVLSGIHRYTPAELARELTRMAMVAAPDIAVREIEERRASIGSAAADAPPTEACSEDGVATTEAACADPNGTALRKAVLAGLVKLGHEIDDDRVTIYRAKEDSGNALHQVTEAIVSAVSAVLARTDLVCRPASYASLFEVDFGNAEIVALSRDGEKQGAVQAAAAVEAGR